ncbi:MAG: hypothetical protein KDN20_16255 [Verrucomicrobiae bacterium]|nr:hypothetical protein [Verrucomicrobiae bacterium]
MSNHTPNQAGDGDAVENKTQSCHSVAKWAALINDRLVPMPGRHVTETILRDQASIPPDEVIVRDHNDPNDPVIEPGNEIDLAKGEVFYTLPKCDVGTNRKPCKAPAKRLIVVNDRHEIVIRSDQSGKTIRDLFGLGFEVTLFSDLESQNDQSIDPEDPASLDEGNVFITREAGGLKITVNNQPFREAEGVKEMMTGAEIAKLVFPNAKNPTVKEITPGEKAEVPLNKAISIENCDAFRVIRPDVVAGFQSGRVERELQLLREGGAEVTLLQGENAVIYHAVPTCDGGETDVLVTIPSGYPAGKLDNAYLPAGSPLLRTAPGAEQDFAQFGGRKWRKKSVHPYSGKSNSPWDQNAHGIHTYLGEILSWLN